MEELNKIVSDEQILTFYFGEFDLNVPYLSPFRKEDNPSFIISYYNNRLVYRDFGISNKPEYIIDFVIRLKASQGIHYSFYDALNAIYEEIVINKKIPILKKQYDRTRGAITTKIKYKKDWEDYQLEYWKKGNISVKTLDFFNVHWCCEVWFGDKMWAKGSHYNLMYFYNHSITPFDESWTVYRPNADPKKKFRKHNIDGRIMGIDLIPDTGELLVITKSYKDIMILYEIGVPAIAPHNENIEIPKETIDNLKSRFNLIYVNYDNDNTGVKSSIRFTKEHNLNYWNLPKDINCKDPFECSCKYGIDKVFDNLNDKIQRDDGFRNITKNIQTI